MGKLKAKKNLQTEKEILFEGSCAYAIRKEESYEIVVFSSNYTTHLAAGQALTTQQAERVCGRLNAYPQKTRAMHGLL